PLFGSLRILVLPRLGLWRRAPIAALSRATVPMAGAGFVVAAASGTALLATNATDYVGNPFLLIKFPAIALGLANVAVLSRLPAWRAHRERELTAHEHGRLAVMGGISLACWLTAVGAGRLIGYW
ncbi:MAG: hypothetical protein HY824_12615, partial [Acidobacteria bacterium]|nr:hypothetical protein [Acidobacteriota bacterium]